MIERNRIHNCGQLPASNHHHGIYVEAADNARIINNWIYDNADRGVQLFPDAQNTYVAHNVIDGNGQGLVVSRTSARNTVENNIITNSVVRYNLEDFELGGKNNIARRNCLWSTRHPGNPGGIQPALPYPAIESIVIDPGFINRAAKDFRVQPGSPCITFPRFRGLRRQGAQEAEAPGTSLGGKPGGVRASASACARKLPGQQEAADRKRLLQLRRRSLGARCEDAPARQRLHDERPVAGRKRSALRHLGRPGGL